MAIRIFGLAACVLIGAGTSAMAQSATQTRLLSLDNPSVAGAPVRLRAEIDGLGGGAPTGWATFWDGTTRIGWKQLGSPTGAGQELLAAGGHHSCALTAAGGAKCWGTNWGGQLGDGTTTLRLTPVSVAGLSSGFAIAAGLAHSCAVTAGGVKCWGRNDYGQLGDGTATDRQTPVPVTGLSSGVVAIAAGSSHSCTLTAAGGVKCWGANWSGQLGDGTTTDRKTPVAVTRLTSGVVAITTGESHSCALTAAGGVKCWGSNGYGQLGDGTTTERHTPGGVTGLTHVVAIATGTGHGCALTAAGGVKCWGLNGQGQLGDGTRSQRLTPVAVTGLTSGVVAIAAGDAHSCALTSEGAVKCWGSNGNGQLGDGSTADWKLTPVAVAGLSSGVVAVAAGDYHNCALTAAGHVKCWGANWNGQLGDGASTDMYKPVRTQNIAGLMRVRAEFTTPPLSAGRHWLRAYYRGDATHAPSLGGLRHQVQ